MTVASEPCRRIRLLTFSHLPLPYFNQPEDSDFEAVCELTSQSQFYEQHYVQRPDWASLIGNLAPADQTLLRLSIVRTPDFAAPEFVDQVIDDPSEWSASTEDGIDWLHVPNGQDWPAEFVERVNGVWPPDRSIEPLVITALNGTTMEMPGVETSLPEGRVRVPLWIVDGTEGCRLQQLTGSLDLLPAMLKSVAGESPSSPLQLPMAESVVLDHDEFRAIRTADFLYVDAAGQESLYAKPTDCWNTNNVSREDLETVDRLAAQLRQEVSNG